MSKPKWVHAPAWAQYLAQDEGGEWYWYEHKPIAMHARHEIDYSGGNQHSRAARARIHDQWRETMEARP